MASLARCLCAETSTIPDDEFATPFPSHMNVPESRHLLLGPLPQLLFQGLCLISVRRPFLDHHLKSKYSENGTSS
ncbi:hypothetical protein CY34DRAFT_710193 [Suillus luteus UH-Slu-Lm8-n1]|uniref:Uncharacterized protein n=1 Tax=Suillus luteus UH-Slu-Lm8-n1 TaxID=930992 RepID=A0A0D0BB30_9AGAM|nr:hypothetical protein CY34DRAFT_710193 [Suillus luteus UH-Slu-Lm8-n1]